MIGNNQILVVDFLFHHKSPIQSRRNSLEISGQKTIKSLAISRRQLNTDRQRNFGSDQLDRSTQHLELITLHKYF